MARPAAITIEPNRVYTAEEARRALKISRQKLYEKVHSRHLPPMDGCRPFRFLGQHLLALWPEPMKGEPDGHAG